MPTIIVKNPANAHAHLFYGLETPVCTGPNSRGKPFWYAKAVQLAMRTKLHADPGYARLMAKNPFHPSWHTQWIPKLYDLGELSEYVTLPKGLPARDPEPSGTGRNFDRWDDYVLAQAEAINTSTFCHDPLPFSEVKSIAKSIAKWAWKTITPKSFSAIQSSRGRKGGRPRTTTKDGEPWLELGISRATWHRWRKDGRLPPNPG